LAALVHKPNTRAFCHRTSFVGFASSSQMVKKNPRSLELLKFKKSEIGGLFKFLYITQLSYKQEPHNSTGSAITGLLHLIIWILVVFCA